MLTLVHVMYFNYAQVQQSQPTLSGMKEHMIQVHLSEGLLFIQEWQVDREFLHIDENKITALKLS